jgi:hypothetical protein
MSEVLDILVKNALGKSMVSDEFSDHAGRTGEALVSIFEESRSYALWWYLGGKGLKGLIQSHRAYRYLGFARCRGRFCGIWYKVHTVPMVMRTREWLQDSANLLTPRNEERFSGPWFIPALNDLCLPCRQHERGWHTEQLLWRATSHSPACTCSDCDWMRHEGSVAV